MIMKTLLGVKKCRPFKEDGIWHLFLDGADDRLVFSEVGSESLRIALCQLPIWKNPGNFWGYNVPKDEDLWNCELPEPGETCILLSSHDNKALEVVADFMSDERCWDAE